MKKTPLIILFVLVLVCAIIFAYKTLIIKHNSESEEKIQLVLDEPYFSALKKLITKNSLEKIAEKNNSKITSKNWDYLNLEMPKILRPKTWIVDGKLNFSTITKDKDLGELELNFCQDVNIDKETLLIKTQLDQPCTNILEYNKEVKITPLDNKIQLDLFSKIKISKAIPSFYVDYMNKQVKEHNKKDIEDLKNNLISIITDKSPVFIKLK
jgi:hypothetical protein